MTDINITFKDPVKLTVNGTDYVIKPLPAGDGFKLQYLTKKWYHQWEKGTVTADKISNELLAAYSAAADIFARNAVDPEKTRAMLQAMKENNGTAWISAISQLTAQLGA